MVSLVFEHESITKSHVSPNICWEGMCRWAHKTGPKFGSFYESVLYTYSLWYPMICTYLHSKYGFVQIFSRQSSRTSNNIYHRFLKMFCCSPWCPHLSGPVNVLTRLPLCSQLSGHLLDTSQTFRKIKLLHTARLVTSDTWTRKKVDVPEGVWLQIWHFCLVNCLNH